MLRVEIIEILRTSKKYSKSNFMYDIDGIHYSINNHTYTITLDGGFSKKLTFRYENYSLNVEPIKISFIRSNIDDKKILYKFGQIIKYINKLDSIICQKEKLSIKFQEIVKKYIKEHYDLMPIFNNENIFKITLPQSIKRKRRKSLSIPFNVVDEDPEKIVYSIYANYKEGNFSVTIQLMYSMINKKLIVVRKDANYRNYSKDITRIIRSEKLKKIMIINE